MDTTTDGGAVDPSAPLAALGGRKQRKIYRNNLAGTFGWACRVCPGHERRGGYATPGAAAEAFNVHHARRPHQRHLRALLRTQPEAAT